MSSLLMSLFFVVVVRRENLRIMMRRNLQGVQFLGTT